MRLAPAPRRVHVSPSRSLTAAATENQFAVRVAFRTAARMQLALAPKRLPRAAVATVAAAAALHGLAAWWAAEVKLDRDLRSGRLRHSPGHHRRSGNYFATEAEIESAG
jgi:hypothetical protein